MPYKAEHAARQMEPTQFDDFRRVHEEVAPDGIDFIYGIKPDGTTAIQSVRADASKWTVEDFRSWLQEHDLTDDFLEPAEKQEAPEPEDEEMAKGDASTPAKPEERIKGSEKNKPGSASGERGGIEISEQVEMELHKLYRQGAGAREATTRLSETSGVSRKKLYQAWLKLAKGD